MIKNERQYRITRAQAEKFAHALSQLVEEPEETAQVHPLLRKAQEEGLRSQLADLHAQLEEYEAIRSGQQGTLELESVEELPRVLIRARIAAGLSQKELAKRLGLKEQQIQRYEATEYASASFARVLDVVRALGIRVRKAS
jgi:ribosome-binding protein aMBF1 (putative translation factor)